MSKKFKVWLDSGANAFSCNEQEFTLEEIGCDEKEWEAMSTEEQEEFMREIAFEHSEWGFKEVED